VASPLVVVHAVNARDMLIDPAPLIEQKAPTSPPMRGGRLKSHPTHALVANKKTDFCESTFDTPARFAEELELSKFLFLSG
jgi:hypothetical protein